VRRQGSTDVVFDRVEDLGECAHIIGNYSAKIRAEEVPLARCGEHLWIRLERLRHEAVNLVLRVPTGSSDFPVLSSQSSAL
jgi:coenzyme F420-reducing hydrogenase delta subunit